MAKIGAGDLSERVTFQEVGQTSDGAGGVVTVPEDRFTRWAQFRYERGNEAVQGARLEGRSIFKIAVRSDSKTRTINTDWRAKDARRGTLYQIREVDSITDRAFVFMTIESGVAS